MGTMTVGAEQQNGLLFVGFNQDYGCFACGMDNGFRIFNVSPFHPTFRRVFSGGVGIVEMLYRTNILALVGGGKNPRYPPTKVMLWDDRLHEVKGEMSFRTEVRAVRLRRDRIVVALSHKIYVYRFSDLTVLDQISTTRNDAGLLALCSDSATMVLACPGQRCGWVAVELYDVRRNTLIPAHESALAQIALSADGSRVATASDRGTLIRVFDTSSGQLVHELRRGMDRADITSLCFHPSGDFLACCSDRGTVHVFKTGEQASQHREEAAAAEAQNNARSGLNFLGGLIPKYLPKYFSSEWSFAQLRLRWEARSLCAFGSEPNTLVVVNAGGAFITAKFDEPGDCTVEDYKKFIMSEGNCSDDGSDDMSTPLGFAPALAGAPTAITVASIPHEPVVDVTQLPPPPNLLEKPSVAASTVTSAALPGVEIEVAQEPTRIIPLARPEGDVVVE